ncbi:MAG: hypothetical protein WBD90_06830 [Xanthobacteraceae bacterium]
MSTATATKPNRARDIVAGFATFVAMSYIIFANPAVLGPHVMNLRRSFCRDRGGSFWTQDPDRAGLRHGTEPVLG